MTCVEQSQENILLSPTLQGSFSVVGKTTILSIIFFICNLLLDTHLSLDFLLCRHPVGWRWGRGKQSTTNYSDYAAYQLI